jgi:hypothetical protein
MNTVATRLNMETFRERYKTDAGFRYEVLKEIDDCIMLEPEVGILLLKKVIIFHQDAYSIIFSNESEFLDVKKWMIIFSNYNLNIPHAKTVFTAIRTQLELMAVDFQNGNQKSEHPIVKATENALKQITERF